MNEILEKIKYGIIVSCQAFEGEPLYGDNIMARMALSAVEGGAKGIRANGVRDLKQIKEKVNVPIIGIQKEHIQGYDVFITPTYKHVEEILNTGAEIVALDCTNRERPETLESIFFKTRKNFPKALIMADIATLDDAESIKRLNPDIIATTLSGYTKDTKDRPKPDLELVKQLTETTNTPIIAEGNYWTPDEVIKAFKNNVLAVTIGAAITRPQLITKKFTSAVDNFYCLD